MEKPPEKPNWYKGRFISKKKYEHLLRRSENGKKNKGSYVREDTPKKKSEEPLPCSTNPFPVEGGRFIDLDHMQKLMFCNNCKEKLHIQDIKSEYKRGLGSYFSIQCDHCDSPPQKITNSPLLKTPGRGADPFEVNLKIPMGK